MANIKRLCLYTGWMDDFRGEDQNGLLSTILRNFHSTLCGYDYAGKVTTQMRFSQAFIRREILQKYLK